MRPASSPGTGRILLTGRSPGSRRFGENISEFRSPSRFPNGGRGCGDVFLPAHSSGDCRRFSLHSLLSLPCRRMGGIRAPRGVSIIADNSCSGKIDLALPRSVSSINQYMPYRMPVMIPESSSIRRLADCAPMPGSRRFHSGSSRRPSRSPTVRRPAASSFPAMPFFRYMPRG